MWIHSCDLCAILQICTNHPASPRLVRSNVASLFIAGAVHCCDAQGWIGLCLVGNQLRKLFGKLYFSSYIIIHTMISCEALR